jgi:hypothetical protein
MRSDRLLESRQMDSTEKRTEGLPLLAARKRPILAHAAAGAVAA